MTKLPTTPQELEALFIDLEPEALAKLLPKTGTERATMEAELSAAVAQHQTGLSDQALLGLAACGLRSLADNHPFVLACAEALIARGSEDGQTAFVELVIQARDAYDPGHRAHDGTVLDRLIDDVLPRFALAPLTTLLDGLDFDVMSGSDGFAELFGAAFSKVEGAIPDRLLSAAKRYAEDCRRSSGDLAEAMTLLRAAAARSPHNPSLAAAISELEDDIQLQATLESNDVDVARAILERVGRDLPFHRAVKFHNSLRPLQAFASQLPYELVEGVFQRAWSSEREPRYPETNLGRTLWPLFVNDPVKAQSFCLAFAGRCDDRSLFLKVVEWAIRDADRQSPEGLESAKDTLALLNGLDPATERAAEALKERRSSLASQISWAFMQGELEEAAELIRDPANRELMNAETVEEIVGYAPLTKTLKAGELEEAQVIAEVILDLLNYKMNHPDPEPDPKTAQRLSSSERRRAKAGGVPSSHSVIEFVTNSLVLAANEATVATPFSAQVAALAKTLIAQAPGRSSSPTLPFNLACYHLRRGERAEALANVRIAAASGKPKAAFLADEDFATLREDPEFLAAIEPKIS